MPARPRSSPDPRLSLVNLALLAFLNTGRHRLRTVANVSGITVTVAALLFFLAFFRGTYEGVMFSGVIDYATAQAQIARPAFVEEEPDSWLAPGSLIEDSPAAREGLDAVLRAAAGKEGLHDPPRLAPRLVASGLAGDGARKIPVVIAGVDFGKETRVFAFEKRMRAGTFGPEGLVLGAKLAGILGLEVGDEIRLQATMADGAPNLDYWTVSGIFSTGYPPLDRSMVLVGLGEAQTFLGAEGRVNKVYCRLVPGPSPTAREKVLADLAAPEGAKGLSELGLVARSWTEQAMALVKDSEKDGLFYAVFLAILLFLSLSTMAGTMRMTVFERRREIGMLRASGWLPGEVGRLFLLEALAIGLVGSVLGCLAGGGIALALQVHPVSYEAALANFDIPAFSFTCDLRGGDLLLSFVAGLSTALLAAFAPARAAARMPLLSALSER